MVELKVPKGPEVGKLMAKQVSGQSRPPPILTREIIGGDGDDDGAHNANSFSMHTSFVFATMYGRSLT